MATVRPVAPDATGVLKQIVAPDTIDATILPAITATTQRTFAFFTG